MKPTSAINSFFSRNAAQLTRFSQALVKINSVHGNETSVAKVIKAELARFGLKSSIIGDIKERGIIVCDIGPKRGKTFMLNGHLDTVPLGDPAKWRFDALSAKISGGKLFGRGSFDMKCSVAAATYAGIALAKCATLPGRIRLVFNYDEESGVHSGIKEVIRRGIGADAGIVCEPIFENNIFIGAKGVYRFELTTIGKTGHTGRKGSGINAVTKMAKLLLALEPHILAHSPTSGYAPPHITPGTLIEGGQGINIYPSRCSAAVDCRLTLGQKLPKVKAEIKQLLKKAAATDPDLKFEIRDMCEVPPCRIELAHPLVKDAESAVEQVFGKRPKLEIIGGVTDGNLLLEAGIPNIGFGVDGRGAHEENEYALVSGLPKTAKAYALTALSYLAR